MYMQERAWYDKIVMIIVLCTMTSNGPEVRLNP